MVQIGFFDADRRLEVLSKKGDPLEAIDRLVPWESFRADIEAVVLTPRELRKSNAGRKSIDAIVMFRMLVLQALYNLSDEETEFQLNDRKTSRNGGKSTSTTPLTPRRQRPRCQNAIVRGSLTRSRGSRVAIGQNGSCLEEIDLAFDELIKQVRNGGQVTSPNLLDSAAKGVRR